MSVFSIFTWLEEWAKWEVIQKWFGFILLGICLVAFLIWLTVFLIIETYKKHSKKYVKKEGDDNYDKKKSNKKDD